MSGPEGAASVERHKPNPHIELFLASRDRENGFWTDKTRAAVQALEPHQILIGTGPMQNLTKRQIPLIDPLHTLPPGSKLSVVAADIPLPSDPQIRPILESIAKNDPVLRRCLENLPEPSQSSVLRRADTTSSQSEEKSNTENHPYTSELEKSTNQHAAASTLAMLGILAYANKVTTTDNDDLTSPKPPGFDPDRRLLLKTILYGSGFLLLRSLLSSSLLRPLITEQTPAKWQRNLARAIDKSSPLFLNLQFLELLNIKRVLATHDNYKELSWKNIGWTGQSYKSAMVVDSAQALKSLETDKEKALQRLRTILEEIKASSLPYLTRAGISSMRDGLLYLLADYRVFLVPQLPKDQQADGLVSEGYTMKDKTNSEIALLINEIFNLSRGIKRA
jgi:hypothetical protein